MNEQEQVLESTEPDVYTPPLEPYADGFAFNTYMRPYMPKRYRPQAIADILWLRQARELFMPRIFPTPLDSTTPILAYDTYNVQHRIIPGSYIWGWDAVVLEGTLSNLSVQVVDPCTRTALFQTFINATALRATSAFNRPRVLMDPFKVGGQGMIDVQVKSNQSTSVTVQVVLLVAERMT